MVGTGQLPDTAQLPQSISPVAASLRAGRLSLRQGGRRRNRRDLAGTEATVVATVDVETVIGRVCIDLERHGLAAVDADVGRKTLDARIPGPDRVPLGRRITRQAVLATIGLALQLTGTAVVNDQLTSAASALPATSGSPDPSRHRVRSASTLTHSPAAHWRQHRRTTRSPVIGEKHSPARSVRPA